MHVLVTKHWSKSQKRNLWISDSIYIRTCLYGCESWCLTEQLYTKLRQFYAQCVRTMSYITLNQSRMHHISTKQIETELGLASMWTNTYEPTVNCDGLDSMSAACPLIVYPDVCSPLGYPTRDQGAPRRWPLAKKLSKHWKPLISIRSTGSQWLPQPYKLAPKDQMIAVS